MMAFKGLIEGFLVGFQSYDDCKGMSLNTKHFWNFLDFIPFFLNILQSKPLFLENKKRFSINTKAKRNDALWA